MLGVLSQDEYLAAARELDRRVQAVGAESVLLLLWGSKYDARVTTAEQARVNREIGQTLGLSVAPLGIAWQTVRQADPQMRLYADGNDGANLYGDYLNAAVLLAFLLDENPRHASYRPLNDAGLPLLSEDEAMVLQRHAWTAVQSMVGHETGPADAEEGRTR